MAIKLNIANILADSVYTGVMLGLNQLSSVSEEDRKNPEHIGAVIAASVLDRLQQVLVINDTPTTEETLDVAPEE